MRSGLANNDDLAEWIAACGRGDREAFEKVYAATSGKFNAILVNMLRSEDTAKDILQKGYLAIWTNAGKFDPGKAKAFTWMLVIMRNKAIDSLRSAHWSEKTDEITDAVIDEAPRPPHQAQLSQAGRLLESRLAGLPAQMAQSVWLHVVEGYSCKEIGERLQISPNTIKSWIRRGLERLRAEMPYDSLESAI